MYFVNSTDTGKKIVEKYDNSAFICSKSNKNFSKFADAGVYADIVENEKFEVSLLVATTVIDTGININDSKVKTIVLDIGIDFDTIQQCIGRKRYNAGEDRINVYIRMPRDSYIKEEKENYYEKLIPVKIFEMFKDDYKTFALNYCYTQFNELFLPSFQTNKPIRVNPIIRQKYQTTLDNLNTYIEDSGLSFKQEITNRLSLRGRVNMYEETIIKEKVEMVIEDYFSKKMFASKYVLEDCKEDFARKVTKEIGESTVLGINRINGVLEKCKSIYRVASKKDGFRRSETYGKMYWIIDKV